MEGDNNKSLTLLAGVAIDKGHESLIERDNAVLYMDNSKVEVQYIIEPSGHFQMTGGSGDDDTYQLQVQGEDGLHYTIATDGISNILLKKCLVCGSLCDHNNLRDVSDESELERLIERYLPNVTIPKNRIDGLNPEDGNTSICLNCISKICEWNEFNVHVSSYQSSIKQDECREDEKGEMLGGKRRGRSTTKSSGRASVIISIKEQCKNLLLNSPYHFLIKRELTAEDWEAMADKLVCTKSNSSPKIKEIETLTMSKERLISIFCMNCCKSITGGYLGYLSHLQDTHKGEDLKLPCDICGVYYPLKDSSARSQDYFPHWVSHFFFEKCHHDGCIDVFPNKITLNRHMEFHLNRPRFPCPVCGKVLGKQATLDLHLKTHLPDEEKRKQAKTCPVCGKVIYAPSLKAHMFSVHSEERPWNCDLCPATFKHKSDLNGHRKTVHDKIRHFVCQICDQRFGHQCGLRVHLLKHENNRQFVCPVCSKRFITRWHLRKHQTTHKTVKDIICEICNKGFKKEESLREHVTLHTGEKPFSCHICGRKVRVLSNLYKHFQVHKKNKTWKSKEDMDALMESTGKVVVTESREIVIPNSKSSNTTLQSINNGSTPTILSYEIVSNTAPVLQMTPSGSSTKVDQQTDISTLIQSETGSQQSSVYETTVWISN
ncbi:unnamed protein product [Allacma fusca]|uniref:C2H2-type domain-containing protein n=1 Tax=Allacma fusca TaxID=39272 RepID=A0A8J2LS89_9HEXA|nr:unnamed protein product [Allacma fusca]